MKQLVENWDKRAGNLQYDEHFPEHVAELKAAAEVLGDVHQLPRRVGLRYLAEISEMDTDLFIYHVTQLLTKPNYSPELKS